MDDAGLTALLERTAIGDRAAFARLYDRTAPKLLALCLRILSDRSRAEAVLADAYAKIWRYAERFPAANVPAATWMAAIVRNLCIERLRAERSATAVLKAAMSQPESALRAETRAIARQGGAALLDRLDGLGAEDARVVRIAYFGGATYGALAEREGVPANVVRERMRRALATLEPRSAERGGGVDAMEFVLSLLDPPERRAFELALLDDPALASGVWRNETMLAPLAEALRPRKPADRVWRGVETMALPRGAAAPRREARRAVAFWRGLASLFGVAAVAAGCLAAVLALRPEVLMAAPPALVSALVATDGAVTLARLSRDGTIHAEPFAPAPGDGREPVLWLVSADGAMALGTLSQSGPIVLRPTEIANRPAADYAGAHLEVTAEPAGAMHEAPGGPVLAEGTLRKI